MPEKNQNGSRRPEDDSDALAVPRLALQSIFDQFMEPFFRRSMGSPWNELGGKEPAIDLQDRGDHFLVTAELPGFEKKDVEVEVDSDRLELKAEKRTETRDEEGGRTQSSRSYFHRYMTLPGQVLPEKVTGTMKNGVLELKLPKRAPKLSAKSKRVDLR